MNTENPQLTPRPKEPDAQGITYDIKEFSKEEDAAKIILNHIKEAETNLAEFENSELYKGLDSKEAEELKEKIKRVKGLFAFARTRVPEIWKARRNEPSLLKEVVLITAKDPKGDLIGFTIFELYSTTTPATIPYDKDIGELHDEDLKAKYPPGTTLYCTTRTNSMVVLPQYQGKGVGKGLMNRSIGRLKEKGVIRYADNLSPDSVKLLKGMKEREIILDYIRYFRYVTEEEEDLGGGHHILFLKDDETIDAMTRAFFT